jgi:predicted nucleic acid-binding protein
MMMIDSSAWIEFLRDTGSDQCNQVERALSGEIATSDPIRMELLAGARDEKHLEQLRRLLARCAHVQAQPLDYENAAMLYRACRVRGETVRKLVDCLIAAIVIRKDMPLLHKDSDFDVLARHTDLKLV